MEAAAQRAAMETFGFSLAPKHNSTPQLEYKRTTCRDHLEAINIKQIRVSPIGFEVLHTASQHALGWMEEFAGSSPIPSVHQPSLIATFSRQIYATCSLRQPWPTTAAATFYLGNTSWGRNVKYFLSVYYSHFIWIQNQYLTTS